MSGVDRRVAAAVAAGACGLLAVTVCAAALGGGRARAATAPAGAAGGGGARAALAAAPSTGSPGVAGGAAAVGSPGVAAGAAVPSAPAAGGAAGGFDPVPGTMGAEIMDLDWLDQDRDRAVPVRLYFPQHGAGPFPAVVFSSGLAAPRGAFDFLGRHLANRGFLFLYVQHPGSDGPDRSVHRAVVRRGAVTPAHDPAAGVNRLLDLVFAIDQLFALEATSPVLHGRVDKSQVAVGGMNVGAWTALSAAGLASMGKSGNESSLPDPRVKAALLLAAPPPDAERRDKLRFEHVRVPCLVVTAVREEGKAAVLARLVDRRFIFDQIHNAEEVLLSFALGAPAGGGTSASQHPREDVVKAAAAAFLAATLHHNAWAKAWLWKGGLAAQLGTAGSIETRLPAP